MVIKTIIVDDETLARDELKYLLSLWNDVEIIAEASDGHEGFELIKKFEPDVAFLDIQMPDSDGLTVAKKMIEEDLETLIVFATAYDQHALKAFEINAIDYLLKPFDEERVSITLERLRQRIKKRENPQEELKKVLSQMMEGKEPIKPISKLSVQSDDRVILLDPKEIIFAFREGRDVLVKTKKSVYTTKYTLQVLEEKLKNFHFFRTHRSYLVNVHYVHELIPWFHGAYNLLMKDEDHSKVPVSRQYVKELREYLEL